MPERVAAVTTCALIPVLWICGPGGVGKSTVSWQLYTELADTGVHVAFADTDQLCMCYPAPPGDPGRQHVKALNVGSIIPHLRSAGAQCIVVNGVLGPSGLSTDLLPGADVTICRLRADAGVLERRFAGKHGQRGDIDELLHVVRDESRLMDDSSFADACIDTTGVPADQVADLIRAACQDWPGFTGERATAGSECAGPRGPVGGGRVALITGPTGVGKSTIGFAFYLQCLNAGLVAGYVDLGQIGFLSPPMPRDPRNRRLRARNLGAIWRNYRAAGAEHLVTVGAITSRADWQVYVSELAGTDITLIRLRADRDELRSRVMSRAGGGSWPEPGDRLRGQPEAYLSAVADHAAQAAEAFDRADLGAVVDTTGLGRAASASLIADVLGWLQPADPATS
jgi:adenylylsulfate kinase-like enzyme